MTSGLGDYLIMGDLMRKVETLVPEARCLMVHRNNPHVKLWKYDNHSKRFYDIYKPAQFLRLVLYLQGARRKGYTVFGLQMAPGSIQGFFFNKLLKKLKALDYIVDFNLINADIIIPPRGSYILDLHLNQIKDLFKVEIPEELYNLVLPIEDSNGSKTTANKSHMRIGIHPWSRRGHMPSFVWPFEKWLEVIKFLLDKDDNEISIFGKDMKFESFRDYLQTEIKSPSQRIKFIPCNSVKELINVIKTLDLLLSVNTSVVHIGYALNKKMVILCGPSLDIWIPKGDNIKVVSDQEAIFSGSDKYINDNRFPIVTRIDSAKVIDALKKFNFS